MKQKQRRNRKQQRGFSLIELLVVLVILGLLASLVLPQMLNRLTGAEYKAAKAQIVVLQNGIDSFALDVGRLPESLEELVEQPSDADFWSGPYIKRQTLTDPWNNEWEYRKPGQHGAYDVISYGKDGAPGGEGVDSDITSWE